MLKREGGPGLVTELTSESELQAEEGRKAFQAERTASRAWTSRLPGELPENLEKWPNSQLAP